MVKKLTMEERWDRDRRAILTALALQNPAGLTKYAYTKGMQQVDAMRFWIDTADLGFVKLGRNERGTNVFGFRSTVEPLLPGEVSE